MKRYLLIAVAVLTLSGLALFSAPAMARDYHPRHVHEPVRGHPAASWQHAARHHANVHTAHVRVWKHTAHRR
jgi:hypothetical protein